MYAQYWHNMLFFQNRGTRSTGVKAAIRQVLRLPLQFVGALFLRLLMLGFHFWGGNLNHLSPSLKEKYFQMMCLTVWRNYCPMWLSWSMAPNLKWKDHLLSIHNLPVIHHNYKSRSTMKSMLGITPSGVLCFVSDLYPGSTADKEITVLSGFLEKLN